jgi:hypothetical protein
MDKEQAMLLEELALFQSRLEGRPISTEEAMRLTIEQLVDSLFPVRRPAYHINPGTFKHLLKATRRTASRIEQA